jgi:hypothetical protein
MTATITAHDLEAVRHFRQEILAGLTCSACGDARCTPGSLLSLLGVPYSVTATAGELNPLAIAAANDALGGAA